MREGHTEGKGMGRHCTCTGISKATTTTPLVGYVPDISYLHLCRYLESLPSRLRVKVCLTSFMTNLLKGKTNICLVREEMFHMCLDFRF